MKRSLKKKQQEEEPFLQMLTVHNPHIQELGYNDPQLEDPKIKIIFQHLNQK